MHCHKFFGGLLANTQGLVGKLNRLIHACGKHQLSTYLQACMCIAWETFELKIPTWNELTVSKVWALHKPSK